MLFFNQLSTINSEFHIALHFCKAEYRETIAALLCLCHNWQNVAVKTSEPMILQIRLRWWYEQYDLYFNTQKPLPDNTPPEFILLRQYDLRPLINAFEDSYVNQINGQNCMIYQHIFRLIAHIINIPNYDKNIDAYGKMYQKLNQRKISQVPFYALPFGLRFLRIPIILRLNQSKLKLILAFIINFFQ